MNTAAVSAASSTVSQFIPFSISLVVAILAVAGTWRIFIKIGEEGWKCIVPFFNEYIAFRAVWNTRSFWKMIGASIAAGVCIGVTQVLFETGHDTINIGVSILSLVLLIMSLAYQIRFCNKMAKAFGKGTGMTLLLIFIPFVATAILGFGPARYRSLSN